MTTKPQSRLGRGLSSLISSTTDRQPSAISLPPQSDATTRPVAVGMDVRMVSVELIDANPNQPRRTFDAGKLERLASSLRDHGTLQPVLVRPLGNRFELLAGERRWRASKLAGLTTIPAIIRTANESAALELALIENIQREDLNAVERARAYAELATKYGLSHEAIGARMGEDRATVSNYIRILDLDDNTLSMVASGQLSMGHARSLLGLAGASQRSKLAQQIVSESWSVRQTEAHVQQSRDPAGTRTKAKPQARAVISDLESRLHSTLGLRVRIVESRRPHHGRVIIDYHSLDDFESILRKLGVTDSA